MKYQILKNRNLDLLIKDVNRLIEQNWKLQGGICVTNNIYEGKYEMKIDETFYQAMTLDENVESQI